MISLESYSFWRYGSSVGVVGDDFVPSVYQYNQYCYPNIEANIFEPRFLKRATRLGSSFLAI